MFCILSFYAHCACSEHFLHIAPHIFLHIFLHICILYTMHTVRIRHINQHIVSMLFCILPDIVHLCIFCMLQMKRVCSLWLLLFISTIAWSPIQAPSYSHTITNIHRYCSWFYELLSQKAPGKSWSADSPRMSKCIVLVSPSGTRGSRPSLEQTGMTYNTCACSRRSLTMADWQSSTQAEVGKKSKDVVYAEYTEYAKYAEFDLVFLAQCTPPAQKNRHARAAASQRRSLFWFEQSRSLQNPMLPILSWKTPSEFPGWRSNTMSWWLICRDFFATNGHKETRMTPGVQYAQSRGCSKGQYDPRCCWTDEDAKCPAEPCSVTQIIIKYAQYAKYTQCDMNVCIMIIINIFYIFYKLVHILHIQRKPVTCCGKRIPWTLILLQ